MMPNATTGLPPNDSPTVTIGGRTYTIEFNLLAEKKLSQSNLTFNDAFQALRNSAGAHSVFELLAATTAHNFMRWSEKPLTGDEWAFNLDPHIIADPTLMDKITIALKVAITKRWPDLTKKAETGPAKNETAPQVQ